MTLTEFGIAQNHFKHYFFFLKTIHTSGAMSIDLEKEIHAYAKSSTWLLITMKWYYSANKQF